jgi:hypothetical protein
MGMLGPKGAAYKRYWYGTEQSPGGSRNQEPVITPAAAMLLPSSAKDLALYCLAAVS